MHANDPYDDAEWRDRALLKRKFDEHDGVLKAIAADLETDRGTIRRWLDHFEIRSIEDRRTCDVLEQLDASDVGAATPGGRSA